MKARALETSSRLLAFNVRWLCAATLCMLSPLSYAADTEIGSGRYLSFHSDPWINLHHFLYQWSRADEGIAGGRNPVLVAERSSPAKPDPSSLHTWQQSLAFYRQHVAALDHFDERMLRQKVALAKLDGDMTATPDDVIKGIAVALKNAMPVYERYWWPDHSVANQRWLSDVLPLYLKYEDDFVAMTARVHGASWPDEATRVDLSAYANFAAGYTAYSHTVMFTTDPGNQGLYALEMLLHEVSHSRFASGDSRRVLRDLFKQSGIPLPRNLWHSIIFATAGEFVRWIASAESLPEHQPYWSRERFDQLADWQAAYAAVNAHWLPVIAASSNRHDAFAALLARFSPGNEE